MPIVGIAGHCYTIQTSNGHVRQDVMKSLLTLLLGLAEGKGGAFLEGYLDTVEYCFDKSIYRILVSRVSFFYQAVGNDHAYRHGLVPHQTAQACQGRTFHLEVGNTVAVVFKFSIFSF